jgi:anti-sigma factor RsiW
MRDRVQAYADEELGVEGTIEVEAHLERCSACREAFERQRSFRRMVGTLYPRQVPPDLGRRLVADLRPRSRPWWLLATGAAAAALGVVLAGMLASRGERGLPSEVRAALELHRSAARGAAPLGLASGDAAEVSRWLHRQVPFFSDVPEAETRGFTLRGAAAVELAGTRAAYVLYDGGAQPVSLFVLPHRTWPSMGRPLRSGNVEFRWVEAGGERVLAWSHDPVSYLLVSDATRTPSETCGVCHASTGAGGVGDPRTKALTGENAS